VSTDRAGRAATTGVLAARAHVRAIMGTMVSIHVVADGQRRDEPQVMDAVESAFDFLGHVDRVFSTYSVDSDICRLARGEVSVVDTDPMVTELVELCTVARRGTGGLFDPWWKGWFDPTGLVKGWSVEQAVGHCLRPLVESGLVEAVGVNAGGDIQVLTAPTSSWTWNVGIADPWEPGTTIGRVVLRSGAIATSGTIERGNHIVDPRSGSPAVSVCSATVVAQGLTDADLWATTACVSGFDDLSWIGQAGTDSGLLIASDHRIRRWVGSEESSTARVGV